MFIKQLSVFVENKPGKLSEVTKLLSGSGIDIRALSVADTGDFGILRLIVNDPEKACGALKNADCIVSMTDVIAVGTEDKPGGLTGIMDCLYASDISVEYMYAFISKKAGEAYVIIRADSNGKALEALKENGFSVLTASEVYEM
ncbi:MAG: ACT domain-containing protein [Prevotella sp.]|nr:ACT domain-containing protein [Prevotella sp.]